MLYGKLYATRRRGRPKTRWLDDMSADLRKMGINEWRSREGIERFGGGLEWRPRPTPGCSAIEEEEVPENVILNNVEEVPRPTYYEVNQVTEKLKLHKAA
jgi:hypothetical protein